MNVTATNHDDVSALLTVTLEKSDYNDKVEKQLTNYAKNAQIPGFRKGKVPLSMVKKQYEAGIAFEEINKQISEALNGYVKDNKLRLVGQPVPQAVNDFDHNADSLSVGFEVGYEPNFSVDLSNYEAPHYKIEASDKEISKSIENMQKRFAERLPEEKISTESYVALEVSQVVEENAEGEHNHQPKNITISKDQKEAYDLIKKFNKDNSIKISKEDLIAKEDLATQLGFSKEEVEHLHHHEVEITVKDIYGLKLAELNQDLFDKVYGKDVIKSEEELKAKIKTELDEYFQQNADVHYVNKILEQVNEKEEIKLPEEFFIKWLLFSNKEITSEEQAKQIFEDEKQIIKGQILEGKLMDENDIKLDYSEVLSQAEQLVRNQLAMYGIHNMQDDEVQKYAAEMLKDENQVKQISSEVAMTKLKDIILEKSKKIETKISHDEFLELLKK